MSQERQAEPILTLEPLLAAVREGLEAEAWKMSGLQKTTSHEFEGRWAGESTRSAYLFFHRDDLPDFVSVEAFLDETSRGLKGNVSLVLDGRSLEELGEVGELLRAMGETARRAMPGGYKTPLTLRMRLSRKETAPEEATTEYRFKLIIPQKVIVAGGAEVSRIASVAAASFEMILREESLSAYLPPVG